MSEEEKKESPGIDLAGFLMRTPPQQMVRVLEQFEWRNGHRGEVAQLEFPNVLLHCRKCNGERWFKASDTQIVERASSRDMYLYYSCKNCGKSQKVYAVRVMTLELPGVLLMTKYGESPPFNVQIPKTLEDLLDDADKALFIKGLQSEAAGHGIGAFTYYRRVLDNQGVLILDHLRRAAEKLQADPALVKELEAAKAERQFTKAVEAIKKGLPPSLYIDGHNPLTLLHDAVSDGVHAETDETCMEYATSVRVVLTAMVRRIDEALVEQDNVKQAVSKLLQAKAARQAKKSGPEPAPGA